MKSYFENNPEIRDSPYFTGKKTGSESYVTCQRPCDLEHPVCLRLVLGLIHIRIYKTRFLPFEQCVIPVCL